METKILYQYVVTYYADTKAPLSIENRYRGQHVVWTDILTGKVQRHDGPCTTNLSTGEKFFNPEDTGTYYSSFTNENVLRLLYKNEIEYGVSAETVEYQYIVTYSYGTYKNFIITWQDILTLDKIHHDGFAEAIFSGPNVIARITTEPSSRVFRLNYRQYIEKANITSNPFPGVISDENHERWLRKEFSVHPTDCQEG